MSPGSASLTTRPSVVCSVCGWPWVCGRFWGSYSFPRWLPVACFCAPPLYPAHCAHTGSQHCPPCSPESAPSCTHKHDHNMYFVSSGFRVSIAVTRRVYVQSLSLPQPIVHSSVVSVQKSGKHAAVLPSTYSRHQSVLKSAARTLASLSKHLCASRATHTAKCPATWCGKGGQQSVGV